MRELRSGVRRKNRSPERIPGNGMVIRRKRRPIKLNNQQPGLESEPKLNPQQQQDDDVHNNVDVPRELDEGYMTSPPPPPPYEEAYEFSIQSAVAQMALRRSDQMSAKNQCLEKGLQRQRLLHESSNSYEVDGETREGSVPFAAPECEVTNPNYEGSVPVDIPECETVKDVVVDSNNSNQKETDKVACLAEDETRRTTRLSAKRKGTPEQSEGVAARGSGEFVSQPTFSPMPKRQSLADKLYEQRKLIGNKQHEARMSRTQVEDQLLNTQSMVSQLEETLATFMQNDNAPSSVSNKRPLVNCGNLVSFSPKPKRQSLAHKLYEKRKLIENKQQADQLLNTTQNMVSQLEETLATFLQNGRGPASTPIHPNNNENLKGLASTSTVVPMNSKENLGKGPASISDRVHLNNTENLGNSPASSSDRANSNNFEPSASASSQSMFWTNDEENLPVVQVTPPRRVAGSVKDSNVSHFQRFYNSVSERMTGSMPFISVPVDAAVFGAEMELYLGLDDVQYMCHMADLSENCVMAYIRYLYDILTKRGIQHKYEFINPASASAAKEADLSKIITSRLMNTNCEWVFIPINPEGSNWLLVAINMVSMSCYLLDPSGLPARCNIKPYVTFGLKGLQKGGVRRPSPIWYNVQCPKQKSSVECGFYVMKFMKEIIDDPDMFTRSEPFPKSVYEQNEIDEVRLEWIQTVEEYI